MSEPIPHMPNLSTLNGKEDVQNYRFANSTDTLSTFMKNFLQETQPTVPPPPPTHQTSQQTTPQHSSTTQHSTHSSQSHDSPPHPSPRSIGEVSSTNSPQPQQLVLSSNNTSLSTVNREHYVDVTEYLNMPQAEAAKKLGIPTSTLSKRWKEAARRRKWPYRTVSKLDKEITTLLHNIPQGQTADSLPEDVQETLSFLLRKRQEELRPTVIRI